MPNTMINMASSLDADESCEDRVSCCSASGLTESIKSINLNQLKVLSLTNSNLHSLSSHLNDLECLRELDLSFNHLSELPEELGKAKFLTKLNVSNNSLKSLPLSLATSLKVLKYVNVSNNKITSLPRLSSLQYLKELNASGNCLKQFPSWLLEETTYEIDVVDLSMNPIFQEWSPLSTPSSQCKRFIKTLNLSNTRFSSSYDLFKFIRGLTHINLSNQGFFYVNRIHEVDLTCIVEPHLVVDLNLANVGLSFSPNLSALTNLKNLNLSDNSLNWLQPETISVPSLESFLLRNSSICLLSDDFCLLSNLKVLDLSRNQISYLPDNFSELCHLEYLDLYHNILSSAPDLSRCLNLEAVDFCQNDFEPPNYPVKEGGLSYDQMKTKLRSTLSEERKNGRLSMAEKSDCGTFPGFIERSSIESALCSLFQSYSASSSSRVCFEWSSESTERPFGLNSQSVNSPSKIQEIGSYRVESWGSSESLQERYAPLPDNVIDFRSCSWESDENWGADIGDPDLDDFVPSDVSLKPAAVSESEYERNFLIDSLTLCPARIKNSPHFYLPYSSRMVPSFSDSSGSQVKSTLNAYAVDGQFDDVESPS